MTKKINLEEIFVSALGSEQKLEWYLKYEINVVSYLDAKRKYLMAFLDITMALIPKEKKQEMIGDMSASRIIKILEIKRSELYKILMKHSRGVGWMERQIELFKQRFL